MTNDASCLIFSVRREVRTAKVACDSHIYKCRTVLMGHTLSPAPPPVSHGQRDPKRGKRTPRR